MEVLRGYLLLNNGIEEVVFHRSCFVVFQPFLLPFDNCYVFIISHKGLLSEEAEVGMFQGEYIAQDEAEEGYSVLFDVFVDYSEDGDDGFLLGCH